MKFRKKHLKNLIKYKMEVIDITKKRIIEYINQGKRFDKRSLLEYRPISFETPISDKAEGSARVHIGKTDVIVGVKLDIVEPYPDSPDEGALMVIAELSPLASERFELGPPKIEAIELARLVDRSIRESGFIDFKKLCIKKEENVWAVFIDIYPINDDGNLIDASVLGAILALKTAVFPAVVKNKVKYGEFTKKKLPLTESMPITLSFYKIGNSIILDPTTEESDVSDARLSIALSQEKKELNINAMQKKGLNLTKEEISKMIDSATVEWKKLYSIIEKVKLK